MIEQAIWSARIETKVDTQGMLLTLYDNFLLDLEPFQVILEKLK